jgi:hypothetical protein
MLTNTKILPGFTEIEFGYADRLFINYSELIQEGSIIEAYGSFTRIPAEGLIGCSVTSETVSGETVYTTLLNFSMKDFGDYTRRLIREITASACCFRITDVYKEKYLLGLSSKPHPTVKPAFKSEARPSGLRAFTVEIQYVNTHSILQLR